MTNEIHDTSVKVDVFPDEFNVILKAINRALDNGDFDEFEKDQLMSFKDDFSSSKKRD